MFAIICAINQDKTIETYINGYTYYSIRINTIELFFIKFFLDENEDVLYDLGSEDQLIIVKRYLKMKKLKKK